MKGTVYKCTFSDGKVYIGKSKHVNHRMLEHFSKTAGPSNPGFYDAYKRLGKPKYEILFEEDFTNVWELEVTLCGIEKYYINLYNATNPEYGYNKINVSSLSAGIRKKIEQIFSEIMQELLKERLKLYHQIINKLWRTKEKLTSDELFFVREKYRAYNQFQDFIDQFDFDDYSRNSDYDLEFLVDDAIPFIKCIIETDTEKEVTEYVRNNIDELLKMKNDKVILKINDLGEVVNEYQSINDICEELNIVRPDNIRNVLRGKQKTAYGYIWKYKKDYEEACENLEAKEDDAD